MPEIHIYQRTIALSHVATDNLLDRQAGPILEAAFLNGEQQTILTMRAMQSVMEKHSGRGRRVLAVPHLGPMVLLQPEPVPAARACSCSPCRC